MREKLSKLLVVFAFFTIVAIGNISPLTASAAAESCVWTGAVSANWSDNGNWDECEHGENNTPLSGDALIFPSNAANKATINNLIADSLDFEYILINGSGYSISGTAFTLTSTTPLIAEQSATISANITYNSGGDVHIYTLPDTTLTLSGTSNFSVSAPNAVYIGSGSHNGTVDFTGNVSGNAGAQFVATSSSKAVLRGTNTFTTSKVGAEDNGTFECRSTTCFGNTANNIYMGGGTVDIYASAIFNNGFETGSMTPDDSVLITRDNTSIVGSGTVNDDITISQVTAAKNLQFSGAITLNGSVTVNGFNTSSNIKFDGALSGEGEITVASGNAWMSSSSASYNGTITVKSGAVAMADQMNSLGSTDGATIVEDGGSLHLDVTDIDASIAEPLQIAGEGTSPVQYKGAIYSTSTKDVTLTGTVALTDDALIYNAGTANSKLTVRGAISGSHDLTYFADIETSTQVGDTGAAANTYTGTTKVIGGQLYLEKSLAIPGDLEIESLDQFTNPALVYMRAPNAVADEGVVTIINDNDQLWAGEVGTEVIGGLVGPDGFIAFEGDDTNLVIDQDFNSTFNGWFYAGGHTTSFIKRGTGNLLLTGGMDGIADDNMKFVVEEGTLTVDSYLISTEGPFVEVKDTGILKGNGTVGKTSSSGGMIAPGNSPGKLTVMSLTLDPTNTLEFELDGPVAGTSYDQIESTGAVNLNNANLDIKPSYTPTEGQVFTIITGSSINGTFKNLPNNATIAVSGMIFKVNYNPTSVTLTYVVGTYDPETNDSLVNTGTGMLIAAIASIMLIAIATALTTRRKSNATV